MAGDPTTSTADDGFWVLTRHRDVQWANRGMKLFSVFDGPSLSVQPEMCGTMPVSMDGRDPRRVLAVAG